MLSFGFSSLIVRRFVLAGARADAIRGRDVEKFRARDFRSCSSFICGAGNIVCSNTIGVSCFHFGVMKIIFDVIL